MIFFDLIELLYAFSTESGVFRIELFLMSIQQMERTFCWVGVIPQQTLVGDHAHLDFGAKFN